MLNVTDATCDYGLAQTAEGCVHTLSSFCHNQYILLQIVYCVMGLLAMAVCAFKYIQAVRRNGAKLQQQIFLLCMYASFTILVRGVDPMSYGHYTPRPISHFLTDSCTATLYTIYIKSLSFYISLTQHGAVTKPKSVVVCERAAICLIWAFYMACDISSISKKGFGGVRSTIQLYVSAGFLCAVSTGFTIYGIRVIRRLESIDTVTMNNPRVLFDSRMIDTCRSIDYNSEESQAVLEEVKRRPLRPADRIRKVLFVTESMSLLCVASQVYFGYTRYHAPAVELECANGVNCDELKMPLSPMHVLHPW
uniref:THH1/TOM1/TOM3 domain-containing protein n=1 Tax=Globisporangium ultimum (strain ATCC 200006 / CBS 805.95 / DAOM BR144) TaxID=431595 RepID=K3WSL8_GLOUD